MLKSNIGSWIDQSGYKRGYIAKELGVDSNTVYLWISGKSYPNTIRLFKLARILNCKVDDLYEWEE